jgi:hypothetical protein
MPSLVYFDWFPDLRSSLGWSIRHWSMVARLYQDTYVPPRYVRIFHDLDAYISGRTWMPDSGWLDHAAGICMSGCASCFCHGLHNIRPAGINFDFSYSELESYIGSAVNSKGGFRELAEPNMYISSARTHTSSLNRDIYMSVWVTEPMRSWSYRGLVFIHPCQAWLSCIDTFRWVLF